MAQKIFTTDNVSQLRLKLARDAERARTERSNECSQEWIAPRLWSQYMGESGKLLYASFSDEELLDILRLAADNLGHIPSQKEIFCVYRSYIRNRFTNWPMALRAAGLKAQRAKANIK